jgi:hypothetical protein
VTMTTPPPKRADLWLHEEASRHDTVLADRVLLRRQLDLVADLMRKWQDMVTPGVGPGWPSQQPAIDAGEERKFWATMHEELSAAQATLRSLLDTIGRGLDGV